MLNRKFCEIPLENIKANPEQPRKNFSKNELLDLANSISKYGVLQPIILKKCDNGDYIIIAGERRVRACREVGLKKIPAIIKEFNDTEVALISLIENIQRENLNFFEEAIAYRRLIDEFGLTQAELSQQIGKNQSTISNKLRLISLTSEIQDIIIENGLTERHARALLKLNHNDRLKVVRKIINDSLNVKQTEKYIEGYLNNQNIEQKKNRATNYISYKIYLNTIRSAFSQIKEVEERATIKEVDSGEYMEVNILIPKNIRCFT